MNLRPIRRRSPDITVIPLLDVLLVLLIFFMVSTTFKDEARLRVQLPQAQGEDVPAKEPDHILIQIDRTGAYYVDERAVVDQDRRTLVHALNGALAGRAPLPVLIQADGQAPHQAVMTAMDAAAELGLNRIAFSATRLSKTPPPVEGGTTPPGQTPPAVVRPARRAGDDLSIPIPPPTPPAGPGAQVRP